MVKSTAIKGAVRKRTADAAINDIAFQNGLLQIQPYSFTVNDNEDKPRRYVIELHKYKGFAMIKYYPFHLKKNAKKYELRGKKDIGFLLSRGTVLNIIYECALLMRDYLEENPLEFVGYVGQIDSKDNKRKREQSQRCTVYNILTSSIFKDREQYKFSANKKFKEVNIRLIRKNKSKQKGKLTPKQMENYNSFLSVFENNPKAVFDLMTDVTKQKVINEIKAKG